MLKPCKARVLLDFGWFHRDSNCFWVCYSKVHLGSNRSSHSPKSTPCKPKPASNKGEQKARTTAKGPRYAFLGVFVSPQVLPPRRLGTDSVTSGSCTRSFKQFSKKRGTSARDLKSVQREMLAASSKQISICAVNCTQWHCARALRAHTARTHCTRTLRAHTARPHCARKIASKILDFADKTSDFANKTLDFATKICERSERTVCTCERTVRACGQQCLYTAAQI